MKGIVCDNEQDAVELSQELWEAIKPIKKGKTSTYCEVVKHPSKQLWMCQIVESGYYWEAIEARLIELDLLNSIENIGEDWREIE